MADDVNHHAKLHYAVLDALKRWPESPEPLVLQIMGNCATGDDKERRMEMQSELGLDAVPPVTECESGAGFWDRITMGSWRDAENSTRKQ